MSRVLRDSGWLFPFAIAAVYGCATPSLSLPAAPVTFERATVWVHQPPDSVRLTVEIADTEARHEAGLAGRASLGPDEGMLFRFSAMRSPDDGFWMYGTPFPLDIAFLDPNGTVLQVLPMSACTAVDSDDCPGYFPEVEYASALEVNQGWFLRRDIRVGARVVVAPAR